MSHEDGLLDRGMIFHVGADDRYAVTRDVRGVDVLWPDPWLDLNTGKVPTGDMPVMLRASIALWRKGILQNTEEAQ